MDQALATLLYLILFQGMYPGILSGLFCWMFYISVVVTVLSPLLVLSCINQFYVTDPPRIIEPQSLVLLGHCTVRREGVLFQAQFKLLLEEM